MTCRPAAGVSLCVCVLEFGPLGAQQGRKTLARLKQLHSSQQAKELSSGPVAFPTGSGRVMVGPANACVLDSKSEAENCVLV